MAYRVAASVARPGLTPLAQQLLPVLYQHRLLTVRQLHVLLAPHAVTDSYVRRQLRGLHELGLAAAALRSRSRQGEQVWYCTEGGADVVEAGGEAAVRAHRMTDQTAASQLQEHTLAVNDTAIAFVQAARRLGHECGPLDWEAERAHRIRDGAARLGGDSFLVPDAVLSYTRNTPTQRTLITWFLEIDRATETAIRLAGKLRAYARYLDYIPAPGFGRPRPGGPAEAWRERYTAFPRLLLVLTGASPTVLTRRIADVRALAASDVWLSHAATRLTAGMTTLQQLQTDGPFAPVVTPVFGPAARTDVLMAPTTT
ncbi:replication-relaxation family protein [Streptomyces sp. PTM05]|uniref:Replication-relaxation family protein n=1 Tax=Streptantibioticus parmotrematis TaxID=2873249 RepID=A0ABS7R1I5_9ACTN|nr:replication-relaxation family protein [Streptantibioticus parmotrematis]MBY8889312.1 replication-relaxation family protein [Streptantibioticus parmotrematis]